MKKLLCKIFGHKKIIHWHQEKGWHCSRCGEICIYEILRPSQWARIYEPEMINIPLLPNILLCPRCNHSIEDLYVLRYVNHFTKWHECIKCGWFSNICEQYLKGNGKTIEKFYHYPIINNCVESSVEAKGYFDV